MKRSLSNIVLRRHGGGDKINTKMVISVHGF